MDALNDADAAIPPLIDAGVLVNRRLKQVGDLVDVIQNGGRDHKPKTALQRLPRHMRRRAMSHNIKRFPRKDRRFAARVISKSQHRKKAPSRFWRRRPTNLQKEYDRRAAGEHRWLQTHVWHAKRFEMIKLWGFKVPLRCYQRGVRPFVRKANEEVVMFDDSYCRLLRFRFQSAERARAFERRYGELRTSPRQSLFGLRTSTSGIQLISSTNEESSGHFEAVLSVHPLFFERPTELLTALCDCPVEEVKSAKEMKAELSAEYEERLPVGLFKGDECRITDETNLYALFSFYGPAAIRKLGSLIKLAAADEMETSEFEDIHAKWKQFHLSDSTVDTLPNGTAFSLLARDPRLYSSFSRLAISPAPAPSVPAIVDGKKWVEGLGRSNVIFDARKLNEFARASISEKKLNDLKANQLAPIKLRRYKVPLLISVWNWCSAKKVTMLLPANGARHFFQHFHRAGFRVGALSDRFILCNELADCSYPFLWLPLTTPIKSYRWKRYEKFALPDLSAFGRWAEWGNWSEVVDKPKRLAHFQSLLDRPEIPIDDSECLNNPTVLLPVRLSIDGRGDVSDHDFIYAPSPSCTAASKPTEVVDEKKEKTFGMMREFKTLEVLDVAQMFAATPKTFGSRKPVLREQKEDDLSRIVGRVVYATSSLLHGRVEALGFVCLSAFPRLRALRGRVELRKPNGEKFTPARLRLLYC
ncbi:Ribonuclease P/MRP protein subunit POP1 containing protein [Aphelenchoides fujianensis]|nr:Ribonuclease P/MRP protein subunit POP1 containing protein [Aphelenchoides fujianensis]